MVPFYANESEWERNVKSQILINSILNWAYFVIVNLRLIKFVKIYI